MNIRDIMTILETVRVFHGSSDNDPVFRIGHVGKNSHTFGHYESQRWGVFFTDNPDFASMYGAVKTYDLNLKRTADLDGRNGQLLYSEFVDTIDAFEERNLWLAATNTHHTWQMFEGDLGKRFFQFLKKKKFDSATFTEFNENDDGEEIQSQTIVVFDPNLIKKVQ